MSSYIENSGGVEHRVDCEGTGREYRALLSSFMKSELFIDPYELTDEELESILEKRSIAEGGYSWIESASLFYSRCHLSKVNHVETPYPWDQLCFHPWQNFPVVTMSRFRNEIPVYLSGEHVLLPIRKKSEVVGCQYDTTNILYFKKNVGKPYVYCYRFGTYDDYYNKPRSCLRFAEDGYKREAMILTGYFAITYLLNHPLGCFPSPRLETSVYGFPCGYESLGARRFLIEPLLGEKKEELLEIQSRMKAVLKRHHLTGEVI